MRTTLPATLLVGTRDRTASDIQLAKGAVHSCRLAADIAMQIRAMSGALWITFEGDPEDHVLEEGETMTFTGPGLLVAEGLHDTNVVTHHEIAPATIARWA
jgi:hypothetical protein